MLNRVRKTKPEILFVLKYGVGLGRIKSRIARLKVAIEGRFLIRLSIVRYSNEKKNCGNVLL